MSHLTIETLARLIDEAPDAAESAHLESCAQCRAELEGMTADAAALAALPELQPSPEQWLAVERRLTAEGLLNSQPRLQRSRWFVPVLQMAAAIVLFVLGHLTAPMLRADTSNGGAQNIAAAPANAASTGAGLSTQQPSTTLTAATSSQQEAAALVQQTQRAYLLALTRYAELATRTETSDPVARLAALESIVLTTGAALGQAPADPVINGYHLTALAQRDATIKQLASVAGRSWF